LVGCDEPLRFKKLPYYDRPEALRDGIFCKHCGYPLSAVQGIKGYFHIRVDELVRKGYWPYAMPKYIQQCLVGTTMAEPEEKIEKSKNKEKKEGTREVNYEEV